MKDRILFGLVDPEKVVIVPKFELINWEDSVLSSTITTTLKKAGQPELLSLKEIKELQKDIKPEEVVDRIEVSKH